MASDEDHEQRDAASVAIYEANFRPVQANAVNRLARPDDVADVVAGVCAIVALAFHISVRAR